MNKSKIKFENNWKFKSLESLEKDYWDDVPKDESLLVSTCHGLRKQPLNTFSTEDLRLMIGQNIGLKFLIPLAIEFLEKNILAEGDLFRGDLLKSVLTSAESYWRSEKENWKIICHLFIKNSQKLEKEFEEFNTGRQIFKAFEVFKKLNS